MSGLAQEYFGYGSGGSGPPAGPPDSQQQHQQQQPPYQQPYQQGYPQSSGYPPTSGYSATQGPDPNSAYNQYQGPQSPQPSGQPPYNYNQGPPPQNWQAGPPPQNWQGGGPPPQQYSYQNPAPVPPSDSTQPQKSGWGDSGTHPAAPIQQSHRQGPAPNPAKTKKADDEGSKGLSDKFSRFKLGHKNKKKDDGDESSSDSPDDEKKKAKAKKKVNHYNPPTGNYQPYPFSPLCPQHDREMIVLEIVDAGTNHDRLVGPNQDYDHPAYKIEYSDDNGMKLYRCEFPELDVDKPVWAGSLLPRKDWLSTSIKFKFPWGKWDFDVNEDGWYSDVGMLEGKHRMRWYFIEDTQTYNTNSFVVRNTDIDEERKPTAAQVIMKNFDNGRIELPARLYRTMEQLDETILVALSVMSYWRVYVKENPDNKESDTTRNSIEDP